MNSILVFGEKSVEPTIYGAVHRICPEAPVPVFNPVETKVTIGMAGNTAANLKGLSQVYTTTLFSQKERIIKKRLVDGTSGYLLIRIDSHDFCSPMNEVDFPIINDSWDDVAALVFSDYNKGFLTEGMLRFLLNKAHDLGIPTFLDTKKTLGEWSKNAFIVKINAKEYGTQVLKCEKPDLFCQNLIVTYGAEGAMFIHKGNIINVPTNKVPVYDCSGAGDTFLAALVLHYLHTEDMIRAIHFANAAAGYAVTRRGVTVVTKEALQEYLAEQV